MCMYRYIERKTNTGRRGRGTALLPKHRLAPLGYIPVDPPLDINSGQMGRKEGNVLFNNALNTFYLRLYGVGHMVKDHSDSDTANPLPPHGILFAISSKGSFIYTIPQTG